MITNDQVARSFATRRTGSQKIAAITKKAQNNCSFDSDAAIESLRERVDLDSQLQRMRASKLPSLYRETENNLKNNSVASSGRSCLSLLWQEDSKALRHLVARRGYLAVIYVKATDDQVIAVAEKKSLVPAAR